METDRVYNSAAAPIKAPRGSNARNAREILNGILWILRTGVLEGHHGKVPVIHDVQHVDLFI